MFSLAALLCPCVVAVFRFSDDTHVLCCREEEALVEQFVFEALVTYMESLALAHTDERSLGRSIRAFCARWPVQLASLSMWGGAKATPL